MTSYLAHALLIFMAGHIYVEVWAGNLRSRPRPTMAFFAGSLVPMWRMPWDVPTQLVLIFLGFLVSFVIYLRKQRIIGDGTVAVTGSFVTVSLQNAGVF